MAKRTNAAFRSLAKHPDSTHNSRIGSSLGGWSATLTQSGLLQGCRNPDTICVRATENVSHSISNTSTTLPDHRSRCLVNHLHLFFIHPATVHFDFRDSGLSSSRREKRGKPDQNRESFSRFPARLRSSWQGEPGPTCPRLGLPQYAPTQSNCLDLSQQPLRTTILLTSDLVKGE